MITVLTPTYNRAHTLKRLFESLLLQNVPFEWLVIDDGSRDGTRELIERLSPNSSFPIRYLWQENSGKHVAINTGVRLAEGEWIFIVDSDDALTPDALETVQHAIDTSVATVIGLCFRKLLFTGETVGRHYDISDPVLLTPTEAGNHFQGDLAYIFRTSALRSNPFPVIEGENFVPELLIWNRIADDGSILCYPSTAIYRCEYLNDGYSANFKRNLRRNPKGFALFYRDQFFRETSPVRKLKCAVRYLQCLIYGIVQ